MKLNAKGRELYEIWEQNYYKENDRLGGNHEEGEFVEGWCIIDNDDYVKTLTDECGLLIFGYDESAPWIVDEWIELYGADDVIFKDCNSKGYTCADVKKELLKYFFMEEKDLKGIYANENFIDDEEKMKDFYELTKEEFLMSYSYLTEEEYDNTARLVNK